MRNAIVVLAVSVAFVAPDSIPADPPKPGVVLRSASFSPGIPMAESKNAVYAFGLDAQVDAKGEGRGTLTLTVTPPSYDEYGDQVTGTETDNIKRKVAAPLPAISLECRIIFEKVGFVGRVNTAPTQRSLFRIEGPKIRSTLYIASEGPGLASGRLLVYGKDERVEHVVELTEFKPVKVDPNRFPPCHPGCFPAGTLVRVSDGTRRIELVHEGNIVTTIGPDGKAGSAAVSKVFTSKNRLVEVRTDRGTALTTEAQPLCLVAGGFQRSGDLKAGDRIWQWRDGRRAEAVVREVAATDREETVYNLIIGDSAIFVAGDFLARGKPPADGSAPVVGPEKPSAHAGHAKE